MTADPASPQRRRRAGRDLMIRLSAFFACGQVMNYIIILFGAATLVAGIIIVINPEPIFGLLRRKSESLGMHMLAVVMRIIIGAALILYAAESRYPTAILILGWVSVGAAFALGIMGRRNFTRLMAWALGLVPTLGRIAGVIAILFGGFLIHAVI